MKKDKKTTIDRFTLELESKLKMVDDCRRHADIHIASVVRKYDELNKRLADEKDAKNTALMNCMTAEKTLKKTQETLRSAVKERDIANASTSKRRLYEITPKTTPVPYPSSSDSNNNSSGPSPDFNSSLVESTTPTNVLQSDLLAESPDADADVVASVEAALVAARLSASKGEVDSNVISPLSDNRPVTNSGSGGRGRETSPSKALRALSPTSAMVGSISSSSTRKSTFSSSPRFNTASNSSFLGRGSGAVDHAPTQPARMTRTRAKEAAMNMAQKAGITIATSSLSKTPGGTTPSQRAAESARKHAERMNAKREARNKVNDSNYW
jgi:hypothetical protein